MASRRLQDLSPAFRALSEKFLDGARSAGLDLLIVCTLRRAEEQADLYALGRTKPGRIVTWARPWESKHQTGEAIDVVPMVNGKPLWSTSGADMQVWQAVGNCGVLAGLEWAGNWPARIREYGHFQAKKSKGTS